MKPNHECAAICGLFCGTCPSYIENECGGCLSEKCSCDCFNGFRDCAEKHKITRCYECGEFPCDKLKDFSSKHIVNGICHHEHVISDLQAMKDNGVDAWIAQQTEKHTCKQCGRLIEWYERDCRCGELK